MRQLLQRALLPHTADVDQINAMFSILPQIVTLLGVDQERWKTEIGVLNKLCKERATIIEKILKLPLTRGKHVLLVSVCGGTLPDGVQEVPFLKTIRERVGVWLRLLAVSALEDVFECLSNDKNCEWPEAATFSSLWMGVEQIFICSKIARNICHSTTMGYGLMQNPCAWPVSVFFIRRLKLHGQRKS